MLSDITLGQYYPGNSTVHKMDPRMKIILLVLFIVAVFMSKTLFAFIPVLLFVVLTAYCAKLPAKILIKGLKPLRFILILTFLMNLFFLQGETILWQWKFIVIKKEALTTAVLYAVRLILLVLGSSLLTLTTAPVTLTDGLERLLSPLKVIHFPAHEMAMMMTIALRFIPTLMEEADKIMKAQTARGADFESGNLLNRAKAMIPLLVPLFVSAFRRAGDLAMAMESRCYHGGEGRTRLHILSFKCRDYAALIISCILIICVRVL